MISSINDPRRAYDDRYDLDYVRYGRMFDARGPFEHQARRFNGDWMREPNWAREPHWARDSHWNRLELESAPLVKVIEIHAQSPHSWEDATRRAVAEAARTVRGIRSIYVRDLQALVEDDQVVCFRVNAKIAFALEDERRRR